MSIGDTALGLEVSKGIVAKFVMAAIGFAGAVVFARVLGPSGYGTFYIILALVHILDNPITGWATACRKRFTEVDFSREEALGAGLLGAGIGIVVLVPIVLLVAPYTRFIDIHGLELVFVILFVATGLFATVHRILKSSANFSSAEWADTLRSLFTTPLQLVFVLSGMGVAGMGYGEAVATLMVVPVMLYYLGVRPAVPSTETLTSISSYAKYSVPNGFISSAASRVDVILLSILSAAAVGQYQIALKLTMASTFVGQVLSGGLMGRVSNLTSRDESVKPDIENALSFAAVLAIPIFFGAAAMPRSLVVTIFGGQYREAALLLVGLAAYRVLQSYQEQLRSVIAGLDRPNINTISGATGLVVNVSLGYILLLQIGPLGIVISTVVSVLVKIGIDSYIIRSALPEVSLVPRPIGHQLLAGGIMFAIVDRLHSVLGVRAWIDLVFLVGIGGVVYAGVLVSISPQFRATARGILSDAI